jgi:hypothetical protein
VRVTAAKQEANVRHGSVVAKPGHKYGVVVGRFNDLVTKLLLEGAYGTFESHGVSLSNVEVREQRLVDELIILAGQSWTYAVFSCGCCQRRPLLFDLLRGVTCGRRCHCTMRCRPHCCCAALLLPAVCSLAARTDKPAAAHSEAATPITAYALIVLPLVILSASPSSSLYNSS